MMCRTMTMIFAAVLFSTAASFGNTIGPTSEYYVSRNGNTLEVVQGASIIRSWALQNQYNEWGLSVDGDVRTLAPDSGRNPSAQYTLTGSPTGVHYYNQLPYDSAETDDSTTNGIYNFVVSFDTGWVYRENRDYSNPVALFQIAPDNLGITYDPFNGSLWISGWYNSIVADYSLGGIVLSSFSTGHGYNGALGLDYADRTLWLVNDRTDNMEQYSLSGQFLGTGPNVGYSLGGEFNYANVPEPASLVLLGSGFLGLAGLLRRRNSRKGGA